MRKAIYLSIMLCIVSVLPIHAQPIMSYGFESRAGTYEEISGGTVVGAGLLDNNLADVAFDGQSSSGVKSLTTTPGIPIGFNFTFNDTPMNKFVIGSGGYLVVGKDNVTINPDRSAFMLNDKGSGKQNVIGIGVNTPLTGGATTEISYKLTGTSPNRALVVQFKNIQLDADMFSGIKCPVNLQIKLYETSNKIELVFKNWMNTGTSPRVSRTGIKGFDTDLHIRKVLNNNWNTTEKRTADATSDWGSDSYPADGLTYTFLFPNTCEKPAGQPNGLKLSGSSLGVEGSFSGIPAADHYLVVMSEEQTLNALPADKTVYKQNDKIGNGTVVSFDTAQTFKTPENLLGSKTYYFHIFAANSFGSFGPVYNTAGPLTGTIKTMPEQPQAIESKGSEYDFINLSVIPNTANNQVLIAITDKTDGAAEGMPTEEGIFGAPKGALNVGSSIEGGGRVVYKGDAQTGIKIENLNSNTLYHFIAWSVDAGNNYSTTSVATNEITWGKLPYTASFVNMPLYDPPFGWETTGNLFRIVKQNPNNKGEELCQLECNITSGDPTNGKEHTAATQWILLNNATNRVLLNCNLTIYANRVYQPYKDWDERDVLEIQVSKDGTNFTTIHTLNKANAPQLETAADWATLNVPFDNFKGEKVKIRLRWKTYAPSVKLLVENFVVEEKPACEYPAGLSVDETSLAGGQALIKWTAKNEENAWDLRFRKVDEENWSNPLEVRTNPYLLTTLPSSSKIELQVRAKCSLTSLSPWSKSLFFTSGYAIPFAEDFNSSNTLPTGWSFENGLLDNPTEFCTGSSMSCRKNWMVNQNSLLVRYSSRPQDWVVTPKIDLNDGSYHGKLEFDLALSKANQNPTPDDLCFAVVISKDGGATFNKENVMLELKKADLPAIGIKKHYTVDLSKFHGIVKLGFYAFTESAADEVLNLDNIAVTETCPAATNAKATDVTPESAVVTWEGAAEEWLTFVRKAGETKKDYTKQTQAKLTLTELTPKTNYEVGITKACAVNDTARVVIVAFTTQSLAPCLQPTEITATPSKRFVTINWTAEADRYNVRFRLSGTEEWIDKTTPTNSITVDGLEPDTEYEYAVQAVCSSAEGDVSPWTETAKVRTQTVTCFPPAAINVTTTHKSATITWEGEADEYQLAYRTGENAWTRKEVKNSKTFTLEELAAATKYTLRMRSICAVNDSSEWSVNKEFTTPDIPECSLPTNLRASEITDTAAKLEWDADESNLTWDLHYRTGASTSWTTLEKLTQKSYQVNDLIANTAYLWSVKATCDEGRTSTWAAQESFKTGPSSIRNIGTEELKIYAAGNIINIQNPSNIKIDRICLYDLNGQIIQTFDINSDENVMIPTSLHTDKVIVKVIGEKFASSYTLILQ